MREVYLFRIFTDNNQTLGSISAIGDWEVNVFKTLELGDHENITNISCIPPGRYKCHWTQSNRLTLNAGHPVFTYEVLNVFGRAGIRIHSANYFYQLLGCIALGDAHKDINADNNLDVRHSGNSVAKFNELMGYADFMLNII